MAKLRLKNNQMNKTVLIEAQDLFRGGSDVSRGDLRPHRPQLYSGMLVAYLCRQPFVCLPVKTR